MKYKILINNNRKLKFLNKIYTINHLQVLKLKKMKNNNKQIHLNNLNINFLGTNKNMKIIII